MKKSKAGVLFSTFILVLSLIAFIFSNAYASTGGCVSCGGQEQNEQFPTTDQDCFDTTYGWGSCTEYAGGECENGGGYCSP